jgi:hypothetical protein
MISIQKGFKDLKVIVPEKSREFEKGFL